MKLLVSKLLYLKGKPICSICAARKFLILDSDLYALDMTDLIEAYDKIRQKAQSRPKIF